MIMSPMIGLGDTVIIEGTAAFVPRHAFSYSNSVVGCLLNSLHPWVKYPVQNISEKINADKNAGTQ